MPLTILHVFCQSEIGGAEAVILNFIRFRIDKEIRHFVAIVADSSDPLSHILDELKIEWAWIPRGRMRQINSVVRVCLHLRSLAVKMQADVALANMAQPYLYARLAFLGTPIPIALYYMMVPNEKFVTNNLQDILVRIFQPKLTFAASRTIASRLVAFGFQNVQTVYHGTPIPCATDTDRKTVRGCQERVGIKADDPIVLMPGRLQHWKGQHLLIEAFPAVLQAHPNAHAIILGSAMFGIEEQYQADLRSRIVALRLQHHVHLVGYQKIPAWLERASIVVHASVSADAFPNVCIEAMAAERPLITNTASGTAEILSHGRDALIIKPNSIVDLSYAIIFLLEQPILAREIATAGRQTYERHCMPDKMTRSMEAGLRWIALTKH